MRQSVRTVSAAISSAVGAEVSVDSQCAQSVPAFRVPIVCAQYMQQTVRQKSAAVGTAVSTAVNTAVSVKADAAVSTAGSTVVSATVGTVVSAAIQCDKTDPYNN